MIERSSPFCYWYTSRQVNKALFRTCVLVYFGTPALQYPMPTVRFPNVMKYYVNNQAEFFVSASTVQDLVDQVVESIPVKFHLVDSEATCASTSMFLSTIFISAICKGWKPSSRGR